MGTSSRRFRSFFADSDTTPPLQTSPPPVATKSQPRRSPANPKSPRPSLFRCFRRPKTADANRKLRPPEPAPAIAGVRDVSVPSRRGGGHSTSPEDYRLMEEIGSGGSATVHRAIYLPTGEIVAVKCLDLDRCNIDLEDIRREAQTMSLIDHPNLLRSYCSFVVDHCLWVVMPFMAEGSCLHLMKFAYPDGLEEPAIASILKETLQALDYLHKHGHIHRDVKAGNILLDSSGAVKLADFGVSACMFDNGDRKRSRNTFKGTPCWMAPEVMQPGSQYDFKADIWSFGITALELAHGHAPFSRYPPMKVLLMTLQNAPPELDYDRDRRFSKSFKKMIATCLVKDQTKRPSAEDLLKNPFFKNANPPELSVKSIFADLPPLWNRVKQLQMKDAEQLALKQMPSAEQEALSQSEYQRGVSAWKFDIEDLKEQASMIPDDGEVSEMKEYEEPGPSNSISCPGKSIINGEMHSRGNINGDNESGASCSSKKDENDKKDSPDYGNHRNVEECEHHMVLKDLASSTSKRDSELNQVGVDVAKKEHSANQDMTSTLQRIPSVERGQAKERTEEDDWQTAEKFKRDAHRVPNLSGPLMLINRASANSLSAPTQSSGSLIESVGDKLKPGVQIKGRFSVTSENMDLAKDVPLSSIPNKSGQRVPLRKVASVGEELIQSKLMPNGHMAKDANHSMVSSVFISQLQNLLHQKSAQQNLIVNILNTLQQNEQDAFQGVTNTSLQNKEYNTSLETSNGGGEQSLLAKISELHARMVNLTDELNAEKSKHTRLQQQLNDLEKRELMQQQIVDQKTEIKEA